MLVSKFVRQQASPTVKAPNHDDLVALKALVEAGKVRPVIDGTYPLAETPEAIAHVAAGHARGTVVVNVSQPSPDASASDNPIKKTPVALAALA
jgi:NADPH:quinone reductase-like Zn-dependent oxidoreductase